MAGFRKIIIHGLGKSVSIIPTKLLTKLSNQRLILPFYHSVSDKELPHLKHLYPIKGVKEFITDLDFLLSHFVPVDYHEFLKLARNKDQKGKCAFLLSFDDGLKEFHDIIAPILLKKGIPAICFVNSGFIDNKDLFFRFKASLLVEEFTRNPKLLKETGSFFKDSQDFRSDILSVNYQNKKILDDIASHIHFDFNHFLSANTPYLSGEQMTSLIKQGFHFGSHSIDHPEFQYLAIEEQIRQVEESIQLISDRFSLDYKTFSFPFTDFNVSRRFFSHITENNIADTTFGCAGQKRDIIPTNFQRIPFEMNHLSGKQILNAELFYYLLKIPFGKNMIYRND